MNDLKRKKIFPKMFIVTDLASLMEYMMMMMMMMMMMVMMMMMISADNDDDDISR